MNRSKPYRFILSGGGTGGHIFPALAVADNIKSKYPDSKILFVGAKGKMEMTKVPEAGYDIIGLDIKGLQRRLTVENLLFPFRVIASVFKSIKLIKKFKPDAVIGFGGYASSPITLAASKMNVPIVIQEQNSYAGLANKAVAKRAQKICVAYEKMERFFPAEKVVITGNPVRSGLENLNSKRTEALSLYGLEASRKTILILGGSLGARMLNESVMENIQQLILSNHQVIWQTGSLYHDEMKSRMEGMESDHVKIVEFIKEMNMAYAAADMIISRAGALTISELCIVGKPVIFVPSPNVAEDHQTKNAMVLVENDAALIVKDADAISDLINVAFSCLDDKRKMDAIADNIKGMAKINSTEDITNEILKVIV